MGNKRFEGVGHPPVRGWRIAYLVACTVGLCLSADLLRLHINVHTDPNYQSYCAISERVNCDTLALSPYAILAGLPLSIWGLFGYLLMAGLAIWGLMRRPENPSWPFGLAFWLSAFSALAAIPLFAIAHFVVESVCIVCAGTYVVSFLLVFFSWQALRKVGFCPFRALAADFRAIRARPAPFAGFSAALIIPLVIVWGTITPYWHVKAATVEGVPTGVTDDGHPWIGGKSPTLTITEFSDYQCPHCQRGHNELRELIETYPNKLRLVHRNFPLDHHCNRTLTRPFHTNACLYARMSVCAKEQGAFWLANDYLFAEGHRREAITVEELAEKVVGLDADALKACIATGGAAEQAVVEDLSAGRELGVRGTPTFAIGKDIFPGRVPPELLMSVLEITPESSGSE